MDAATGRITLVARVVLAISAVAMLGASVVVPALANAMQAPTNVDDQIAALNERYAAEAADLPEGPSRGTAQTALNDRYEKDFASIGGEAPNGPDPSIAPSDRQPRVVAPGIHDANENPQGYELTNYWADESAEGGPIFVAGASVEGDSKTVGVYVADDRLDDFYPAVGEQGRLRIISVTGTLVTLSTESGSPLKFDYSTRTFVNG